MKKSSGFQLWQVSNEWQRMQRSALEPMDLTHVQFVLLASLSWLENQQAPVTQAHLADHATTDPMMTSQVLRTLEKKGWIIRSPHPEDSRAMQVVTTAQGRQLLKKATSIVEEVDKQFFGSNKKRLKEFAKSIL